MSIFNKLFGRHASRPSENMAPQITVPDVQVLETGILDLDTKARLLLDNRRYEDLMFLYLRAWNKLEDDDAPLDLRRIVKRNEILAAVIRYIDMVKDFHIPLSDYDLRFQCNTIVDEGCPYAKKEKHTTFAEYLTDPDKYPCENCTATYRKHFCSFIIRPIK